MDGEAGLRMLLSLMEQNDITIENFAAIIINAKMI